MLLLDGHSSHYQPSVVHKAAENDIVLFCLPPHTTHLAQPLDRTCFSPLKQAWNEECRLYMATNPGKKVNRYNFTQLFARAWEKAMTPSNIASGFRATGICPFNRSAIKIPGVDNVSDEESPILKATRLAYVPFISPAHPRKPDNGEVEKPFTDEEELRFQIRYENGYDLTIDKRYNRWLQMNHPGDSHCVLKGKPLEFSDVSSNSNAEYSSEEAKSELQHEKGSAGHNVVNKSRDDRNALSELLVLPTLPAKTEGTGKGGKGGKARVLTSKENFEQLAEKERQKQEQEELKRKRKEERESKKRETL